MAIKFQYNKTSLQQIEKQLKMRQRTLPIIKNKETALRLEVKRCKEEVAELEVRLKQQIAGYESMYALWGEFDATLVELKDVEIERKKVAGVVVPVLTNIRLEAKPFGIFSAPKWYFDGIKLLHGLAKTLTVGHLRSTNIHANVELPLHSVNNNFKVQLAHSLQNCLACLLNGFNLQ